MALKLKTAPAVEPVTLTEAKAHLRVDGTDEDTFITSLIVAAREYCEKYSNRACITQTWYLWLDSFPCSDSISLPLPPLQSVASIKYYDTDNAESTISNGDYFVDPVSEPGRISLAYGKRWPGIVLRPVNGVCIEFVCGYGLAVAVPQGIKQAILLLVGHWYGNREAAGAGSVSKEIEFAVSSLLGVDRVVPV